MSKIHKSKLNGPKRIPVYSERDENPSASPYVCWEDGKVALTRKGKEAGWALGPAPTEEGE